MKIKRKRSLTLVVVLLVLGVGVFVGLPWFVRHHQYIARKTWKEQAIPEIVKFANDPKWVNEEIALLVSGESSRSQRILAAHWLTDRMILMATGEWLVYKSHAWHEDPPLPAIGDIFLAKGSDGKWYYSSFHFCVDMIGLIGMQDVPPYDLATFALRYQLREFDGISDECLQPTQSFPNISQTPDETYAADHKPGLPDLSPLSRAATAAADVAVKSDPDLAGHGLQLDAIRYEHRFSQPDRPASISYEAIYSDSTLHGGDATGIEIEVRDHIALFKSQKGQPLWSCALDGQPSVPDDAVAQIALGAIGRFWPKIAGNRLTLDEIVCCDPIWENKYSVSLRLSAPFVGKPSAATYVRSELYVSTDGTVARREVRWTSR